MRLAFALHPPLVVTVFPMQPLVKDWSIQLRWWIERQGKAILGQGRAELLEGIARRRSISAAARAMKMSYRHAWLLVQAMNEAAGVPLVEAAVGGRQGGGATLTLAGQRALAIFRELDRDIRSSAAATLPRALQLPHELKSSLHLAAAISLQAAVTQIVTEWSLVTPAVPVRTIFGASDELVDQVLTGMHVDLFLSADRLQIERLQKAGKTVGKPRVVARNGLAIIAPREPVLEIRTLAALKRWHPQRVALADAHSPLGRYSRAWLEQAGLAKSWLARARVVDHSRAVFETVAASQAEVGIVFTSDAVRSDACQTLHEPTASVFATECVAVVLQASGTLASTELLDFFQTSISERCFRRCGFHPDGLSARPARKPTKR